MSSDYEGKLGFSRRPQRGIQRRSQLLVPASEVVQIPVQTSGSPHWSPITKLLVGLVIVGIIAFLFNRFASLVTPLLMIIIIVYLLHPAASTIALGLGTSWKVAVHILFLVLLLSLIGLLTLGGLGLVGQIQSLIVSVQTIIVDLPKYLAQLSTW